MVNDIVYDASGILRSGLFYVFEVLFLYDERYDAMDGDTILAPHASTSEELTRTDPNAAWMRVDAVPRDYDMETRRYDCPRDRSHVTQYWSDDLEADVMGGTRLSAFIPDLNAHTIVTGQFRRQLVASGLTGCEFAPVDVKVNQSGGPDPVLFEMRFAGANFVRPMQIAAAKNACPFCGRVPVLCPDCGLRIFYCQTCKQFATTVADRHEGPLDPRLTVERVPKAGPILDGRRWDGSDLASGDLWNFVSKRALDWLLSVHAAPFSASPARVCIDGMSAEQLARLDAITRPLAPDGRAAR